MPKGIMYQNEFKIAPIITRDANTDDALLIKVSGDTHNRFVVKADGKIEFGSGSNVSDVIINRLDSKSLGIDGFISQFNSDQTFTSIPIFINMGGGSARTHNVDFVDANIVGLKMDSTYVFPQTTSIYGMGTLFAHQSIYKNANGVDVDFSFVFPFADVPVYRADAASISFGANKYVHSLYSSPFFDVINGGTLSLDNLSHIRALTTIGSGVTITNRRGIHIHDKTGSGTLTNQAGLAVDPFNGGSNNVKLLLGSTNIPSGDHGIHLTLGSAGEIGQLIKLAASATQDAIIVQNSAASTLFLIDQLGRVKGPNGSAAGPSFSFHTDPDLGIYRVGANNIAVSVGNAKIFDLKNNGGTLQIGFFGGAPANLPAAITTVSGGTVIDTEARTAINALLAAMRTLTLIAT